MPKIFWRILRDIVLYAAALIFSVWLFGDVLQGMWHTSTPSRSTAVINGTPTTHGYLSLDFGQSQEAPLTIHRVLDSGAADVEIQPGDVILTIAGVSDPSREAVLRALEGTKPGDEMPVTIRRDEREFVAHFRLIGYGQYVAATTQK